METGHIVNQYVFIEKLGDGGMGEVWRGRHSYLDYDVAIKFLKPQFAHDRDLQERFLNEGKRQASLDHPNIVRATDFVTESGRNYLVMKFVEGQGLDGRIEEAGGPLPMEEALNISCQVLSALGYAHRAGVVHRDVKPSNILIDNEGKCYLTDFGIALATGQVRVTRTGTVIGTAHYMSPEQIRRPHAVDGRSDIYAFGVVLFEMLTGKPPFDAEGDNEFLIKQAHVQEEPPKPSKLNPAVSKPIESVILCALEKQPEDRWSTCEEMAEALSLAAMGKRPVPRRTQPVRTEPPRTPLPHPPERQTPLPQTRVRPRTSPVPLPSWETEPETVSAENWFARYRGRVAKLAGAAVFLALVGVGAMRMFTTQDDYSRNRHSTEVPIQRDQVPADARPSATPSSGPSANVALRSSEVGAPNSSEPVPARPADSGRARISEPVAARTSEIPTIRPTEASVNVPRERSTSPQLPTTVQTRPAEVPADTSSATAATPSGYGEPRTRATAPTAEQPDSSPAEVTQVVPPRRVGDDHRNPRIQILRPEPPPVTAAPATPDIPASGTIQWALELRKGDVEVLSGSQLSSGRLMSGQELPGVPIAVSIQPPGAAGVVEAPSPGNGWKTLRLRGLRDGRIVISIQWRRL